MEIERIQRLLTDAYEKIIGSEKEYLVFLSTSAWNYKYSLEDRLLIYSQRSEAIACAGKHVWEDKVGRRIKDGAVPISLIGNEGVIDVYNAADTVSKDGNAFYLFELDKDNESAVLESMKKYLPFEGDLMSCIKLLCESRTSEALNMYMDDISQDAEDFLRDSVIFMVCDRLGKPCSKPSISCVNESFKDNITFFAGLKACQAASEAVLREFEKAVKPVTKKPSEDKVRKEDYYQKLLVPDKASVPDKARIEYILSCDRFMNNSNEETAAVLADDTASSDAKKAYIIASYDDSYNMFYYLGKEENGYVGYKKEKDGLFLWEGNYLTRSSEMFLSWDEVLELKKRVLSPEIRERTYRRKLIDAALGTGTHDPYSREKIKEEMGKNCSIDEKADFLRQNFGRGSKGFYYDNKTFCLSFDADGIYISEGERFKEDGIHLSYEDAAMGIGRLIEKDSWRRPPTYISEDDIDFVLLGEYEPHGAKDRIYSIFRENGRKEERINLLKEEYGKIRHDASLDIVCDDRGFLMNRPGDKPANCAFLPWEDVLHRIGNAVKKEKESLDERIEAVQLELAVSESDVCYGKGKDTVSGR